MLSALNTATASVGTPLGRRLTTPETPIQDTGDDGVSRTELNWFTTEVTWGLPYVLPLIHMGFTKDIPPDYTCR